MARMKEFAALLDDIAENLDSLRDNLRELRAMVKVPESETDWVKEEPAKKVFTIEEVRAVLSQKVAVEVQALLGEYGVRKLSEISPEDYGDLIQAGQSLTDKEAR